MNVMLRESQKEISLTTTDIDTCLVHSFPSPAPLISYITDMSDLPYTDLASHLRMVFGCRAHKIALDTGLTCPNRDGTRGLAYTALPKQSLLRSHHNTLSLIHSHITTHKAVRKSR